MIIANINYSLNTPNHLTNYKNSNYTNRTFMNNTKNYDSVSFKGFEKRILSLKNKTLFASIASLFGILSINKSNAVIENEDSFKSEVKLKKALTQLRSSDGKEPLYSKKAIEFILKTNEEDSFFAYKLAKMLENSSDITNDVPLECIAKNLKECPERVYKYREIEPRPDEYTAYLFSADVNEQLTDKLIKSNEHRTSNKELTSRDVFSLVCLVGQEFDSETIERFALEKRIVFNAEDIERLCEKNISYSSQIEKLLDFIDSYKEKFKPWDEKSFDSSFVPDVIETFSAYPKEVKNLMLMGILKAENINKLAKTYSHSKKEVEILFRKSSLIAQEKGEPINYDFIKEYSEKLDKYYDIVNVLLNKHYGMLKLSEIKALVDTIEQNEDSINRIIEDGREKDYQKLIPIYNKYPAVKITEQLIAKETDPLARFFNF